MFCTKCGKSITDGSKFCNKCGAPVNSSNIASAPVERKQTANLKSESRYSFISKVAFFLKKAPLFTSGLIMTLLSGPISLWADSKMVGSAIIHHQAIITQELYWGDIDTWAVARSATKILGVFSWVSVITLVLGAVLYIVESRGMLRNSKLKNVLYVSIPRIFIIFIVVLLLFTCPPIFRYVIEVRSGLTW